MNFSKRIFYRLALANRNLSISSFKEYFGTMLLAVALALLVRIFLFTAYKIPTGSMLPTLLPGDFIFAFKPAYAFGADPKRGDIVIFNYPTRSQVLYLKRVIALSGDKIEITNGAVKINGKELLKSMDSNETASTESNPNPELFRIQTETADLEGNFRNTGGEIKAWNLLTKKEDGNSNFGPLIVPPGEVFLLGDNRDASDDSREWGTVPIKHILGKALFIWFSVDRMDSHDGFTVADSGRIRWNRVFKFIQ